MTIKYEYAGELIGPFIEKWSKVIPPWLYSLTVVKGDPEMVAEMSVQEEYRQATLSIGGLFFAEEDKEGIILHELCHLYTCPVNRDAREACSIYLPDREYKLANYAMCAAMERATEDLKEAFRRVSAT